MSDWANDAIFYHIHPLGLCGAPERNDGRSPPEPRLARLGPWVEHARSLGATALYLGPVLESSAHGYDTVDLYRVDRRLGTSADLRRLCDRAHGLGMRVILDAVLNHVGRDFWAFRDLCQRGAGSPYVGWFRGLRFDRRSPFGDPFAYEGWSGCYDLVKLEHRNAEVIDHLLGAVERWIAEFDIDGLRVDAAESIDLALLQRLRAHTTRLRPDFWLMGEVVRGDYRRWANGDALHSVTNYECFKALYSSHADRNYFELAFALDRQFGEHGLYRDLPLYSFADNHDVNRVASNLRNPAHLYPLYCLLLTMPGVPSIYYGSEWGIAARRSPSDDRPLRPCLELDRERARGNLQLEAAIGRLTELRRSSPALRRGRYRQLAVRSDQLAFARETGEETMIVAANAASSAVALELRIPGGHDGVLTGVLDRGASTPVKDGKATVSVPPCWASVMRFER
jgi:cyclomaltodextrinase / maltogenic alpha-amylase / neopullulanase